MVRRRSNTMGNMQSGTEGNAKSPALLRPKEEDVIAAVVSLYEDELKPFGRILRKRCGERAGEVASGPAAPALSSQALSKDVPAQARDHNSASRTARSWDMAADSFVPDVDPKYLKALCVSSTKLWVVEEEGAEWSALLPVEDPEDGFVDVYGHHDPYPEAFWSAACGYFESLSGDEMFLPGGRYACAQELQRRRLDFLERMSLGRVCHVVQVAMAQRKLLGYFNGEMVPYAHSQSCEKERCAAQGEVCADTLEMPLADWDTARACLKKLLEMAPSNLLSVSNVKRLFRSEFQIELSETRLGHSKLTTLLLDERLRDVCSVRLHGHGHAVVQVPSISDAASVPPVIHEDQLASDSLKLAALQVETDIALAESEVETVWPPSSHSYTYSDEAIVKNTFIHVSPTSQSSDILDAANKRSRSLPKYLGSRKEELSLPWSTEDVGISFDHGVHETPLPSPRSFISNSESASQFSLTLSAPCASRDAQCNVSSASTSLLSRDHLLSRSLLSRESLQSRELADGFVQSECWSVGVEKSFEPPRSAGVPGDDVTSGSSLRQKLRAAGQDALWRVWGSPPGQGNFASERARQPSGDTYAEIGAAANMFSTDAWTALSGEMGGSSPSAGAYEFNGREVTATGPSDGSWEFAGLAAMHVWRPVDPYAQADIVYTNWCNSPSAAVWPPCSPNDPSSCVPEVDSQARYDGSAGAAQSDIGHGEVKSGQVEVID